MRPSIALAGVLLALSSAPELVRGQAGTYWTEQFGNRSMLLSGAVIGSVSDLGLVFYNPGRLGLIEEPSFVLTARGYQWDEIRLEDALGEGADLKDSRFGGAPTLAAGAFRLPFLEGHRFAYGFLTRRRDTNDPFFRAERSGDLTGEIPGEEYASGTVDLNHNLKEEWIGITWAPEAGGNWSGGVSTFYYHLSRKTRLTVDRRFLTETNELMVTALERSFQFRDQGILWKAGLAGNFHPFSIGLTLTSPHLSMVASGKIEYEDLMSGNDPGDGGAPINLLVASVQKDLPTTTKSPWAVGAGVGVEWGRVVLHFSGEWYSAVPEYVVNELEPFRGQSTGELTEFQVVEEFESVLNGAVGIEWHQGEMLSLFGSFATNGSATPDENSPLLNPVEETNTYSISADHLQVAGGFAISTDYLELTLGASYSWASENLEGGLLLPDFGDGFLFGAAENARYVASRWRFLFGFSFPFANQLGDRIFEGPSRR